MSPLHFPKDSARSPRPGSYEPHPALVFLLTVFLCMAIVMTLFMGDSAYAMPVISEVHWAGSDLSTSDEWLEISGTPSDPITTMSGWTLTSVNSSGVENVIFKFPAHAQVVADQFMIVSRFGASQSRLLIEPAFVSSSITLPNSKLLLRLRDPSGAVIDQVDDGVGEPFAGENMSSPVRKSSMERIDLATSGTDVSNWVTATEMVGWDPSTTLGTEMVMRGTPGFRYTAAQSSSAQSSSAQLSSAQSSIISSSSSVSSVPSVSSSSASLASSASSASCLALDPYFILQSGATSGIGKVTLNIQLGTRMGSLSSATCTVDFGDGTTSASCNPPAHTFDEPGNYSITADVKNSCGTVSAQQLFVTVSEGSSSSSKQLSNADSAQGRPFDFAQGRLTSGGEDLAVLPVLNGAGGIFVITGVLPNPEGKDDGKEWIEIANMSNRPASLEGWTLRLPHAKKGKYVFGIVGFGLSESKRFLSAELGMVFPNTAGELSLLDPSGRAVSALAWKDARDGNVVRLEQTFQGTIKARVTHIVDGDTLDVSILQPAPIGIGRTERVRMIGIDAPEIHASDPRQRMLAKRSVEFLRELLEGTTVALTPGADARDSYGRLLAYVATDEGDSVQEMLLREGLATVYLRYAFAKESEFIGYQREAQEANSGLWGIGEWNSEPLRGISEKLIIKHEKLTAVAARPEASSASRAPQIVHLPPASSSSRAAASSKAKKSSSSKKRAAVKTAPKAVVPVKKKSSSSSSEDSGLNMSLLPALSLPAVSLSNPSNGPSPGPMMGLEDLIEDASAHGEGIDVAMVTQQVPDSKRIPVIWLGVFMTGMALGSGIGGWLIARKNQ